MKLSISETRKQLPSLVRRMRCDPSASIQITFHNEVVAELRAAQSEPEPGVAAKKLLDLIQSLPPTKGRKHAVSSHVKTHLYGSFQSSPTVKGGCHMYPVE